jgi:hypothetical protein
MKTFSPSEAAFEGFRVIRDHPGAVLAWAIAYAAIYVGLGAAAVALFGPSFAQISTYSHTNPMPPGLIGPIILFALLALPFGLITGAVFINAVYRPILKPADKGLFYLKLGGDELRVALLIFVYILLFLVCEIGIALAFLIVSFVFVGAIKAVSHTGGWWVHILLILAAIFAAIWIVVRLSLAAPTTFARGKLDLFGSWAVTRGKFWPLLGCYILAWIFGILVALLGGVVSICAGAVVTGDWTAMSTVMTNPRTMMMSSGFGLFTHVFTVATLVQIAVSSLMSAVSRVILYAPAAAAYRDLTASGDA